MDSEAILYKFFGYWQVFVCLFAFVALLTVHRHIVKNQSKGTRDQGLLWLSIAVLVWTFSGVVDIFYARDLVGPSSGIKQTTYQGLRGILSILNSAFILLALPQFKHIPKVIYGLVKSEGWRIIVLITFLFSAILTLLMLFDIIIPSEPNFIYFVDLLYAIFTLTFLGLILWSSFANRKLKALAILSAITIVFTLLAQFLKLDDSVFWSIFFSCVFKTILIMLFFALALSWIEELSQTYISDPQKMHLILVKRRGAMGKFDSTAILTCPPRIQTQQISLSEKPYQLLSHFAEKRKSTADGWLEIQPRSDKVGQYDIKDYKQISRLLDALLNEVFGLQGWTNSQEKTSLKQSLFDQNQQRKIRLRIPPENIDLRQA